MSSRASFMRASSTCISMALSGFLTSCATPLVMRLMAERRSASLQLAAHLAGCLRIAQAHQQAGAAARIVPRADRLQDIHREQSHECARPSQRVMGTRRLRMGRPVWAACASISPSVVLGGKTSGKSQAHQVSAHSAQEFLHRAGGHHQPAVTSKHQHRVFQLIEKPLEIAAQIGEIVLRAAELLAEQVHLGGHDSEFIGPGAGDRHQGVRIIFALGHQVEHVSQAAQRPEGDDRKQQRDAERPGHRRQGHAGALLQRGYDINALMNGG